MKDKAIQILLVEDNEIDTRITVSFLHKAYSGVDVNVAKNGREALDVLNTCKEGKMQNGNSLPDLIILDVMMPVLDGHSFMDEVKKDDALKQIPVIVFSSRSREGLVSAVDGVEGHVAKDFGGKDLISEINKVLYL